VPGERTLSDVWGPARTASIHGSKYYISFTDDTTRTCTALFLKMKGEATQRIKDYVKLIEKKFGKTPKYLPFDNGKELVNKEVQKWAAAKGIEIETTAPYSPSQHGVAERFNRTLLELACAMLIEKNLPPYLWAEAVAHAAYIRNRSPTKALDGKIPHEVWTGRKPNISHFREFGSDVWVLHQGEKQSKLAPKSKKMKFMGFLDGQKAMQYYDPSKCTVRVSKNVAFNENDNPHEVKFPPTSPGLQLKGEQKEDSNPQTRDNSEPEEETRQQINTHLSAEPQRVETPTIPITYPPRPVRAARDHDYRKLNNPQAQPTRRTLHVPPNVTRPTESSSAKQRSRQEAETNIAIAYLAAQYESDRHNDDTPRTIEEASASPEREQWEAAIQAELDILKEMGTWKLADLPEGREPIRNKWTFLKKRDAAGNIVRYKARLVAQGFSQKPGVDFSDTGTFAPVMRFDTLCTVLAISTVKEWDL
jgi:hypothetical protein